MFSGGEKKSFYELSIVIGLGIIALNLKTNKLVTYESIFVFMYAKSGKKFIFLSSAAYCIEVLLYRLHRQFRDKISIIGL